MPPASPVLLHEEALPEEGTAAVGQERSCVEGFQGTVTRPGVREASVLRRTTLGKYFQFGPTP